MYGLMELMESMNKREKEKTVEIDHLLGKIDQLKKHKHCWDEMMEHIKTFLKDEQENKVRLKEDRCFS